MTVDWYSVYAVVAVAMVMLSTGVVVIGTATGHGEIAAAHEESKRWCSDHGGELQNSMSVVHGGLHCKLPNETTVHMSEVDL